MQFSHKNKSKSEIINDKIGLWANTFFSVITKNSNQEISTKNLVTLKDKMVLPWYFWSSLKNPTFREGSQKTNIEEGLIKKGGLEGRAWQERVGGVFEGVDTPMHTMTIWKVFLNKME